MARACPFGARRLRPWQSLARVPGAHRQPWASLFGASGGSVLLRPPHVLPDERLSDQISSWTKRLVSDIETLSELEVVASLLEWLDRRYLPLFAGLEFAEDLSTSTFVSSELRRYRRAPRLRVEMRFPQK